MALSPKEELELLELEEEEYQANLAKQPSLDQKMADANAQDLALQQSEGRKLAEAGLAGAAQGATFGFSDELGAGLDVAGQVVSGKQGLDGLSAKWRELQKTREAANKALEEESPWAYGVGELTGGLASAVATPGLTAAKVATGGGKLLGVGAETLLAGKTGSKLANITGKGLNLGVQGLLPGAAYGLGSSEADISKPLELAQDTASGATMGLIGGAALGASGQVGKETLNVGKEIVKDSDFLRQVGSAYDYGKKGLNLGSSKTQDKISLIPGQRAEDLVNKIFQVDEMLGQKVGSSLENAQLNGVKVNVDPELQSAFQNITTTLFIDNPTLGQILDPKSTKLLKTIGQQELGDLSPVEARALKDELFNLSDKLAGYNSDQANFAKNTAKNIAISLDKNLKASIPEYQQAAKEFEQFRRLVPESIISKGTPSQFNQTYVGSLKNPELKLYDASKELLKKAKLPGEAAAPDRASFEILRRNLEELQRLNPKAAQALGGGADKINAKLGKQADELAMVRQAMGFDPQEGPKGVVTGAVSGLISTGRGIPITAANKTGLIAQSKPVKTIQKVFNATDDQLMQLAGKLKGSPATEIMGNSLEVALQNKNDTVKKAVLFKLMQIPEYREMLSDKGDESNE